MSTNFDSSLETLQSQGDFNFSKYDKHNTIVDKLIKHKHNIFIQWIQNNVCFNLKNTNTQ